MHINRDLLMALFRGEISSEELLRLAQEHLLDRCRFCRQEFTAFVKLLEQVEEPEDTALLTFDRRRELLGSEEFKVLEPQARRWQRELAGLPRSAQLEKVQRARTRFRGPVFGNLMLEMARAAMPDDPAAALHLARIAQVATILEEDYREVHILALAYQANAHRVLGNVDEAEHLFKGLRGCMDLVTDTRTIAEVASFEGSMALDHRLFTDAEARFNRAISLYRLVRDTEGEARNLLNLGSAAYYAGHLREAVLVTREALRLVADEESELYLSARHNLGVYLLADGAAEEVATMLVEDLPLYRKLSVTAPRWNTFFFWLSGRAASALGNNEQAEALFHQTRGIFEQSAKDYEAALVGLDLLRLYVSEQRFAEVLRVVEEILPVFARYELAPETLELLSALESAVQRGRVGAKLLERVTLHLEHARRHTRV